MKIATSYNLNIAEVNDISYYEQVIINLLDL